VFVVIRKNEYIDRNYFRIQLGDRNKTISIAYSEKDNTKEAYLIYKTLFRVQSIKLDGFEDGIKPCQDNDISRDSILCLVGDVGVHGENLALFKYSEDKFKVLPFYSQGVRMTYIFSDAPKIQLIDYNDDGIMDVYTDNRNYDVDPLNSVIRTYYRGSGSSFTFDKEILVNYDSDRN